MPLYVCTMGGISVVFQEILSAGVLGSLLYILLKYQVYLGFCTQ